MMILVHLIDGIVIVQTTTEIPKKEKKKKTSKNQIKNTTKQQNDNINSKTKSKYQSEQHKQGSAIRISSSL